MKVRETFFEALMGIGEDEYYSLAGQILIEGTALQRMFDFNPRHADAVMRFYGLYDSDAKRLTWKQVAAGTKYDEKCTAKNLRKDGHVTTERARQMVFKSLRIGRNRVMNMIKKKEDIEREYYEATKKKESFAYFPAVVGTGWTVVTKEDFLPSRWEA